MSRMTIECKTAAGMDIKEAALEARRISRILDVWVEFNFNGINISVNPESDPDRVVVDYHEALRGNISFIIV